MGRHAASESFLSSWIRHGPFDELAVMAKTTQDAQQFKNLFQNIPQDSRRKATVIDPLNHEKLNQYGCLYLPDPNLISHAHQRARSNRYNHSLCGVTHTLASFPTLELISNYLTAPIYPWDALICTSKVVQQSVTRLLQESFEYLKERFNAKLNMGFPQLPLIPLGTEVDRTPVEQRTSIRAQWRRDLNIAENEVVFLFNGRLSFHAKANPLVMYRALQEVATKTDKRLVLIQAGWFANTGIEKAFVESAREWAPNVRSVFLDGRLPKVRTEIRYACDIFISLSDNIQETFGLTPIEAMASGLPCVVSDWNGYKDTVRHGVDGYRIPTTIPSQNEAHLPFLKKYQSGLINYDHYIGQVSHSIAVDLPKCVEACLNLVDHPELRKKFGQEAQQRVATEFAWEKIIYRYVELFKQLDELRRGSAHIRLEDKIHPVYGLPFESFPGYPTHRLNSTDQFYKVSGQAEEDLVRLYQNPMFSYGGLEPLELMQKILKKFPHHKGIHLRELPAELGSPTQKDRIVCFLLKTGLIQKL